MVQVFVLSDKNKSLQHKNCFACEGRKTDGLVLVRCSLNSCRKYCHLSCLSLQVQKELEAEVWYCSDACKLAAADLVDKTGETPPARDPAIATLVQNNTELLRTVNELATKMAAVQDENKVLVAQLQATTLNHNQRMVFDTTLASADESLFNMSALSSTIRRNVGQLSQTVLADVNAMPAVNVSCDPLHGKVFDATSAPIEHAKSSYLLSLKEIRKNLGELPEFDGKGYEFLNFKMKYDSIKDVGKYTDFQMVAKLEKCLKGKALEHVRIWLFSPNPNPAKIMSDLEEKFYHPNIIIQEALKTVQQFESMPKKNRDKLEDFKRAVDAYIHVCTTVKESIHLNGRLPGDIEDKLPDDLCEEWLKIVNLPNATGNWMEFSIFLGNSVRFMKVRLSESQKLKDIDPKSALKVSSKTLQDPNEFETPTELNDHSDPDLDCSELEVQATTGGDSDSDGE